MTLACPGPLEQDQSTIGSVPVGVWQSGCGRRGVVCGRDGGQWRVTCNMCMYLLCCPGQAPMVLKYENLKVDGYTEKVLGWFN